MARKLKKSEYPEYIGCLAQGCPNCPLLAKGMKYDDCVRFDWKKANRGKYDLEVENGRIVKVIEL